MTAEPPPGYEGPDAGPTFATERPRADVPVFVPGFASSAILSGSSEFTCVREARGGALEWGGVYGQGVRLTGPWVARVQVGPTMFSLPETLVAARAFRWRFESEHSIGPIRLHQEVVAWTDGPGIVRRLTLANSGPEDQSIRVGARLSPFLAPVLLEGLKPFEYRVDRRAGLCAVSALGFSLAVDALPRPNGFVVDGSEWTGGARDGDIGSLDWETDIVVPQGETRDVHWTVWGGRDKYLRENPHSGAQAVAAADGLAVEQANAWRSWTEGTPTLVLPDAPGLELAYRLARGALRSLYTRPEPGMSGLVAGVPWYGALWCRDLAWMLPAVVWMGDWAWAEASMRTVFQYQARGNLPILGALAGELPMQVSPGPVFLFGTSDTTLYYPPLLCRLSEHSGERAPLEELYPHLVRIGEWGRTKTDPATGLLRNGGEVQRMTAASETVGRIHLGIDAADTTIWDSTDRRDHALDVQVLWGQAMAAIAWVSAGMGRRPDAVHWQAAADQLRATVARVYWWPEQGYLYDSLRRDGSPVRKVRPNALRAVSAGWLSPEQSRSVVARGSAADLTTTWGVRTLSSADAAFDPIAYHDGQVWTIATAWAADAALRVGDVDRGFAYLTTIAERIVGEFGQANECYRGDRPEPYDSCFLLGFSVAPFLSVLFESLWGLRPRMTERTVEVRPRFPSGWSSARLEGVRLGDGTLDLAWSPGELTVHWTGTGPLTIDADGGSIAVGHGEIRSVRTLVSTKSS